MAILFPDGTLLIETPQCGTTWVRHALNVLQIPHSLPNPAIDACPRHAPAHCYGGASRAVAMLREPTSWLVSFWRFHKGIGGDILMPGRYYPHRHLFPVLGDFGDWVRRLPDDCIDRVFVPMAQGCLGAVRQESLEDDLARLLGAVGHPVEPAKLSQLALQQVSRPHRLEWPDGEAERLYAGNPESWRLWRTMPGPEALTGGA